MGTRWSPPHLLLFHKALADHLVDGRFHERGLYGKGGEFASNKLESQELLMLSLPLLQVSLVYVNTLMIQQVLAEPGWQGRLTAVDLRALSPLKWQHVNPYGRSPLIGERREVGGQRSI